MVNNKIMESKREERFGKKILTSGEEKRNPKDFVDEKCGFHK